MKRITLAIVLALAASAASADSYVNPYVKRDGTYVQGHMRSSPDATTTNNWSTRPNVNPYNGQRGYANPSPVPGYVHPGYVNPHR
jgi:hypothetical protein